MRTAKTLIRLGGCPGWSESSMGAHATLLVLSWGGFLFLLSGYDKTNDTGARVYPFGDKRTKERKWSRANTQNEARSLIVSFLLDKTLRLTASGLQDFLIECFSAKPSKCLVYLMTGILSLWFVSKVSTRNEVENALNFSSWKCSLTEAFFWSKKK